MSSAPPQRMNVRAGAQLGDENLDRTVQQIERAAEHHEYRELCLLRGLQRHRHDACALQDASCNHQLVLSETRQQRADDD